MTTFAAEPQIGRATGRVVALEPTDGDVLVLTTVFGKRVAVHPVADHLLAVQRARMPASVGDVAAAAQIATLDAKYADLTRELAHLKRARTEAVADAVKRDQLAVIIAVNDRTAAP